MPVYEFVCKECGKPMEVKASVAEYSEGLHLQCPSCGSDKLARTLSSVGLVSSRSRGGPLCGPGGGSGCCG